MTFIALFKFIFLILVWFDSIQIKLLFRCFSSLMEFLLYFFMISPKIFYCKENIKYEIFYFKFLVKVNLISRGVEYFFYGSASEFTVLFFYQIAISPAC